MKLLIFTDLLKAFFKSSLGISHINLTSISLKFLDLCVVSQLSIFFQISSNFSADIFSLVS